MIKSKLSVDMSINIKMLAEFKMQICPRTTETKEMNVHHFYLTDFFNKIISAIYYFINYSMI